MKINRNLNQQNLVSQTIFYPIFSYLLYVQYPYCVSNFLLPDNETNLPPFCTRHNVTHINFLQISICIPVPSYDIRDRRNVWNPTFCIYLKLMSYFCHPQSL